MSLSLPILLTILCSRRRSSTTGGIPPIAIPGTAVAVAATVAIPSPVAITAAVAVAIPSSIAIAIPVVAVLCQRNVQRQNRKGTAEIQTGWQYGSDEGDRGAAAQS